MFKKRVRTVALTKQEGNEEEKRGARSWHFKVGKIPGTSCPGKQVPDSDKIKFHAVKHSGDHSILEAAKSHCMDHFFSWQIFIAFTILNVHKINVANMTFYCFILCDRY